MLYRSQVLWHLELFSARLLVKVFKTLNGRQSHIPSKFHKLKKISRSELSNLQFRRILGGRNLVRVRNVVVAAIFDFMARPISSSLREVSTWRFRKKTLALQAMNYHKSWSWSSQPVLWISISCFCWSQVFGCSLLFSVQSITWQAKFDVITSWPFIPPPRKTGGKLSLLCLWKTLDLTSKKHFRIAWLF